MFSCTFIGHRDCPDFIEDELYMQVENLIVNNSVKKFYVGSEGKFDFITYKVLLKLKKKYNIEILVVLAYLDNKKNYYNQSFTVFPEILEKTPRRYAILKRNHYMIDKSQFMICYVDNSFTNAYSFLKYALIKKLKVINLGKYIPPN